jgi:hypothetical protein
MELKGIMSESASFDGSVLRITRGRAAAAGKGEKTVPVSQVTAVQLRPATRLQRGWLEFSMVGSIDTGGKRSSADMMKKENVIVFAHGQNADARALHDAVLAVIAAR